MSDVCSVSACCSSTLCDLLIDILQQQLQEGLYAATLTGYE